MRRLSADGDLALELAASGGPAPGTPGFDLGRARCGTAPRPERDGDLYLAGVRCRLYRPRTGPDRPRVALYLHGGGWILGDMDTDGDRCRRIAGQSGLAILSVGYRLAPEYPFPAALDDVVAVYSCLSSGLAPTLNLDATAIALIGDSSGGNLAAAASLLLRDQGYAPAAQILLSPVLDLAVPPPPTPPGIPSRFTPDVLEWCARRYAVDGQRASELVSPLRAPSFAGLPPTVVITGEHDILRPAADTYLARLGEAGVPATGLCYRGMPHWFGPPGLSVTARHLADATAAFLMEAL